MDGKRCDTTARALIDVTTRRQALGGLLGGAIAALGVGGSWRSEEAAARKKRRKKKRKKRCKPCRGKAQGGVCTTNKECCANETGLACALTSAAGGPVCCGVLGAPCDGDGDCCRGFECFASDRCVFVM